MKHSIFESQATGSTLANTINVFDPLHAAFSGLKSAGIPQETPKDGFELARKSIYQIEINDYRSEESGQIRYN